MKLAVGGSPGLVVIIKDTCSEGCGSESQLRIVTGHFSHLFVEKLVMLV